ncbi:YktB family protein [Brochothrix campestris]|uniref:UPF0637 protein BCAMP_02740 n=1 Tax=Brochothrix campestris FSL F6-1037 TaxID=1265861 RepID=W7D1A3_9LIST|nr:DUF1054 domain-containing protein [Brochothrix campestris]EUJ41761.1 hypothetical protein BCAMP_02740 [Brochothrix campestris FSL F6-1037]
MTFNGFLSDDFTQMTSPTLEGRMHFLRETIQPKFYELGGSLTDFLSVSLGNEMYLHVAKHLRRSVNPPDSTWLGICHSKRGYKKHPHFQVGIWKDYIFLYLSYIYETENRTAISDAFLENNELFAALPADFVISPDHTENRYLPLTEANLAATLTRFKTVKKGEFLVGKVLLKDNPLLADPVALEKEIEATFTAMLPLYKLSMSI